MSSKATSSANRAMAAGLALVVAAWVPSQALAWIPQSVPGSDTANATDSAWLASDNSALGMIGTDAQVGGQIADGGTPRLAFRESTVGQRAWGGENFAVTDSNMFGMNWMYWAAMAAGTGVALAALADGGGHSSRGQHGFRSPGGGHDNAPVPAPEPSSLLIFGMGALLVGGALRRRSKA